MIDCLLDCGFSGFNTASGIRLCNLSINAISNSSVGFNTASGIRLCNVYISCDDEKPCFNTASGIRLCNSIPAEAARVLA